MAGIKHLIECHCYLAIYKSDSKIPPVHKFPVYSKIDSEGKIIEKVVKCNNCDSLHKVFEIGKSQFIPGKDETMVNISKNDLSHSLPVSIKNILNEYHCDISTWEHVVDIIEERRWSEPVIIKRDIVDEKTIIKILEIKSADIFNIRNETIDEFVR
jgi:hypothetical protein